MNKIKITVLVVDDHMLMRSMIQKVLFSMNITNITFAKNGSEALKKIQSKVFDIVLTDLQMPELSGEEFLKKVRDNKRYDNSALLVISSNGDKKKILNLINQGATSYLPKPFSPEQLQDTIISLLSWLEKKRQPIE